MSQSLSGRLHDWSVRVVYWYTYILGQLPAPLNWKDVKFEQSRLYLCYSILVQCLFLAISPLGTPFATSQEDQQNSYMQGKPILSVTYYIGKSARVMTIVVITIQIWLERQRIIDLFESYVEFKQKHKNFFQHQWWDQEMHSSVNQINIYTVCKLGTSHLNIFGIGGMYFLMQSQVSSSYARMIIINLTQSFHLAVANVLFYMILSKMYLNFQYINKSLEKLLQQGCYAQKLNCCWYLYCIHFECYQLSRRILDIWQPITLFSMIKMFTTNVIILYHAVLFTDGTIETKGCDYILGLFLIVGFYWDAMSTMFAIDNLLTSCNCTTQLLGYFHSLPGEEAELVEEFRKMLSQFHEYLSCHKLQFYIFGMFSLDMATTLQYFIFGLVHLIVLVQFDYKWRT